MKIYLSSKADRQLRKLPQSMHELLLAKIESLEKEPFPLGNKKLAGREGWRVRVGDYRLLYTVDLKNKELTILSAGHRKEIYRL